MVTVRQHGESSLIAFPAVYLLTERGERFFAQRRIPMRTLRLRDGATGYGVVWRSYKADHVRRFVSLDLVRRIEAQRPEFVSQRKEVMALGRETIFGALQRTFARQAHDRIRFNLVSLGYPDTLNAGTGSTDDNRNAVAALRRLVLREGLRKLPSDGSLSVEEIEERKLSMESLVGYIGAQTYRLLRTASSSEDRHTLLAKLVDETVGFAARFGVADYVALILMELLQYAERTQLESFAARDTYVRTHPEEMERKLADPSFRERLFQRAKSRKDLLSLTFGFPVQRQGHSQKLTIEVRNRGLLGYQNRRAILQQRRNQADSVTLQEFYESGSTEGYDAALGTYYLTFLDQACKAVGIEFQASVTRNEREEATVTTIVLGF